MKEFTYIITDPAGLHARPAGQLVQAARAFSSDITLRKGDRTAGAARLLALMRFEVRQGDAVTVTAEGPDEEEAAAALEQFFREHL